MTRGKLIDEIKIGDSAQISNTVTETVINDFAKATGDFNPIHLNQTYAEETYFKGRIAHGVLSIGYISSVLGNLLPGPGGILLSQEAKFLAPVRIGDVITARVEVIELIPTKNRVKFKTTCTNQKGEVVVDGTAWSLCPQKK
ncbi:MAG TPA: MaoC family dehydratase [Thermodesulfobacteriota bacterium]|nr:MaoC family dehydratase [Thermodesulfobacteriota bacterium]